MTPTPRSSRRTLTIAISLFALSWIVGMALIVVAQRDGAPTQDEESSLLERTCSTYEELQMSGDLEPSTPTELVAGVRRAELGSDVDLGPLWFLRFAHGSLDELEPALGTFLTRLDEYRAGDTDVLAELETAANQLEQRIDEECPNTVTTVASGS